MFIFIINIIYSYFISDSHLLSKSVSSVILYHWTSSREILCHPKKSSFQGNLFVVNEKPAKDIPGRAKGRPSVYSALVDLLTLPDHWVFDPLCGEGTYTM